MRTASDSVRRARPLLGTFVEISVAGAATSAMHAGVEAAFGAVAVGALAIGRLAVGRLAIKRAHFRSLEVDELTVRKLRVIERDVGKAD